MHLYRGAVRMRLNSIYLVFECTDVVYISPLELAQVYGGVHRRSVSRGLMCSGCFTDGRTCNYLRIAPHGDPKYWPIYLQEVNDCTSSSFMTYSLLRELQQFYCIKGFLLMPAYFRQYTYTYSYNVKHMHLRRSELWLSNLRWFILLKRTVLHTIMKYINIKFRLHLNQQLTDSEI